MKRVHPRDALFSFGGETLLESIPTKIWQRGDKV
jgi:hypothetical protein